MTFRTVAVVVAAALALSACQESTSNPGGLAGDQRRRADQLVSIFENGSTTIAYDYAANLHDGRGVTAGRAGFTTSDGDALRVITAYTAKIPGNPLARFTSELQRLADGNEDTSELPEADYIAAWRQAAADLAFRQVQDEQVDQRYFQPAMAAAGQLGLTTALARAELYDASIQHGTGTDHDALPALISRTNDAVGTPARAGERAWLDAFLTVRADDLRHPANKATQEEWAQSVDRVDCVRRIAESGNLALDAPLSVTAFGSSYNIG